MMKKIYLNFVQGRAMTTFPKSPSRDHRNEEDDQQTEWDRVNNIKR
jgi:hypothetical protein